MVDWNEVKQWLKEGEKVTIWEDKYIATDDDLNIVFYDLEGNQLLNQNLNFNDIDSNKWQKYEKKVWNLFDNANIDDNGDKYFTTGKIIHYNNKIIDDLYGKDGDNYSLSIDEIKKILKRRTGN